MWGKLDIESPESVLRSNLCEYFNFPSPFDAEGNYFAQDVLGGRFTLRSLETLLKVHYNKNRGTGIFDYCYT